MRVDRLRNNCVAYLEPSRYDAALLRLNPLFAEETSR